MKFEDGVVGSAVVVAVEGRVDAANADLFEAHCGSTLTKHNGKSLVLGLDSVTYLSSAGLRAILRLERLLRAQGGRLVLFGVRGPVREIFQLAGFLDLFPVVETLEKALALPLDPRSGATPENR